MRAEPAWDAPTVRPCLCCFSDCCDKTSPRKAMYGRKALSSRLAHNTPLWQRQSRWLEHRAAVTASQEADRGWRCSSAPSLSLQTKVPARERCCPQRPDSPIPVTSLKARGSQTILDSVKSTAQTCLKKKVEWVNMCCCCLQCLEICSPMHLC